MGAGSAPDRYLKDVFALGLRQPYRGSFVGKKLYVGDIGVDSREEVNMLDCHKSIGANLGWPVYEGNACFIGPCTADSRHEFTFPQYEYSHGDDSAGACAFANRAVLGGVVYQGTDIPFLRDEYVQSDVACHFWRTLTPSHHRAGGHVTTYTVVNPAPVSYTSSIGVDGHGELYQLGIDFDTGSGYVHRLGGKK